MVRRKVDLMIKKCKKEVIPDFRDTCKLAADLISCKLKYSKRVSSLIKLEKVSQC
uniref:Uncharacterized protein n=1 Tax=Rhodnius prolixus TaxID=13249 RepID=T1I2K7_RHOPR